MAEEKQLYLVERRAERGNFPEVVASPTRCRTKEEIPADEIIDFTRYVLGGKVTLEKKKWPPFYQALPSWETHLKKTLYRRNLDGVSQNYFTKLPIRIHIFYNVIMFQVKIRLLAQYGELRSFLTDKYPECRRGKNQKVPEKQE